LWWNKKDFWITEIPKSHIQIIKGSGKIKEIRRTTIIHEYISYSSSEMILLENTFYFPDWTVQVDTKPVKINYKTPEYPARIVFKISKGVHYIKVQYSDINQIKYAKILSLILIFVISTYSIIYWIKYLNKLWLKKFYEKHKK